MLASVAAWLLLERSHRSRAEREAWNAAVGAANTLSKELEGYPASERDHAIDRLLDAHLEDIDVRADAFAAWVTDDHHQLIVQWAGRDGIHETADDRITVAHIPPFQPNQG